MDMFLNLIDNFMLKNIFFRFTVMDIIHLIRRFHFKKKTDICMKKNYESR